MINALIVKKLLPALLLLFMYFLLPNFIMAKNISSLRYVIVNKDTIDHKSTVSPITINTSDIISFGFYNPGNNNNNKYNFFLSPIQKEDSTWTPQNYVSYYQLKQGNYTFHLKCQSGNIETYPFIVKKTHHILITTAITLIIIIILSLAIRRQIKQHIFEKLAQYKKNLNLQLNSIRNHSKSDETIKLTRRASTKYQKVTILFADIQGFTKIVEHLNPETLIDELDRFFIRFDEIAEKFKIEKIKTIGDAYMCAGGLPDKNRTNPIEVILAALEMQSFMGIVNNDEPSDALDFWEVRIGIHTGPVISGIIGRKKLSFDIWGDSVNIASRMESSGVAGKINISGVTYELIKDFFVCEYRGKMPIKYKGETDMYFVDGIKPHLSINNEGKEPNEDFHTQLQWIRFNDMEEFVLEQLSNELSSNLKYHNVEHTIDVCTQVEIIGRAENLNTKELLLVKTAALFHDTGFLVNNNNHEDHSIEIAKEIMPKYQFSENDIATVVELISSTKQDELPNNTMSKILKDADLDYLGRADFIPLSEKLWEEICYYNGQMSMIKWNEHQYNFLISHVYYTNYAKALRQVKKEKQIKKLMDLLKI